MRILGIDYGTKRIGVALSDPDRIMAHPHDTILVKPDGSHMDALKSICDAYRVTEVVVGLPYNMDGSLGQRGQDVLAWGKGLERAFGLRVTFWDERLSTSEAHEMLIGFSVKGRRRRQVVDKIAASIILQGYLDSEHA